MNLGLTLAIIAGLAAMLGWGTADFFAKKSIDKVGHVTSIFWMQALGIIPLVFFVFWSGFSWSQLTQSTILLILFFAAIDAVGYLMFYKALEKGKVSIIGPIVASYAGFSVIISTIFLGEKINLTTGILLAMIFAGIIIISTDINEIIKGNFKKQDFVNGLPEALLGVVLFSIWFPFWDKFITGKNWLEMLFLLRIVMSLMLLFYSGAIREKLILKDKKVFGWLLVVGILDVLAYFALTWGYSVSSHTSIIIMLSSIYSVPTLILARLYLNERLNKFQIFGIGLILLGVAALAFA
jgi:drug/metabolite transporter (DMT)-like permease